MQPLRSSARIEREIYNLTRGFGSGAQYVRQYLDANFGHKCVFCGKIEGLIIDHRDNNPENKSLENLQYACRSCNFKKNPRATIPHRERERDIITERARDEDARDRESPEITIARDKQPLYDKWVFDNINRPSGLTMFEAIYEGSKQNGIAVLTARHYLYQLLATSLRLGEGPRGHRRVLWRDKGE